MVKQAKEKEIFENDEQRKEYMQYKWGFIQQQIKKLTTQAKPEANEAKKASQSQFKTIDCHLESLPKIPNPRDQSLLSAMKNS